MAQLQLRLDTQLSSFHISSHPSASLQAAFALTSKIMSLAAPNFDLVPLVPCFHDLAFVEDTNVAEAVEAVKVICR